MSGHSIWPSVPLQVVGTLWMQPLLQFYSDSLKHYRCLGHGLKISKLFGHNPQIIFCHFFSQNEFSHFSGQSEYISCVLCMQLPLQFYSISFEILQVFRSWVSAVRTACDIQIDGRWGTGRSKLMWKKLTEKDCHVWSSQQLILKK